MTRAQYNPGTGKASYDAGNELQQVLTAECGHCTAIAVDGITPTLLKITFSNILACHGFSCCEDTVRRITDYGIGWNHSYILEQGRVLWSSGKPYWANNAMGMPCWWSAIHTEDYGGYDEYNLNECLGGLVEHHNFYGCVPRAMVHESGGDIIVDVHLHLNGRGETSGNHQEMFIFSGSLNFGSSPAKCMPYGTPISNDYECSGSPMPCFGNGTAVITEWPPP